MMKAIGKTRNLDLIVSAEKLTISREVALYGEKDKLILPSLKAASYDIIGMEAAIKIVNEPEKYQDAAATYHHRKKRMDWLRTAFMKL